MYRNTYAEVNLTNIKHNIKKIINTYSDYDYYFGVVKAWCYGHGDINVVKAVIKAGCNYLAVATLDEALEIRGEIEDIPILCLEIVPLDYIKICADNKITITISDVDYLKKVLLMECGLKVHIKLNTGMNRLGINSRDEFNLIYQMIKDSNLVLEGIYTHIYDALDELTTNQQYKKFEELIADIDLTNIPIVHIGASDVTMRYPKLSYCNGCRLGICMYGLMSEKSSDFLPTFSLYSEVIQINEVEDDIVGYNGAYRVNGKKLIAVVSIGYADGISKKNTGRYVYINDRQYKIVGNICMDMLFVLIDEKVKVGDKVVVIKDIEHIRYIADYLDTITYEVICSIGRRVPRVYIE